MDKRQFLGAALVGAAGPALAQGNAAKALKGPALLTVTGAGVRANRGPFDPIRDQMMGKQKLTFTNAHAFDFAALTALPAVQIQPTLEYDSKPHKLSGPLVTDVLKAAGVSGQGGKLAMRAVDGYAPVVTLADVAKYRFIVATHLDGQPMPLGGLGPLWALYDPDRFPDMMAKPVDQRFANCPWGLFHIDVQAG
ncbi:molybdopterin-dependent oxidoreductase [Ramlibacter sp. USB13]|uniref:Molybdopterin-dependent oxidoreductase n=1 Tax=Ramlibacter cellulosilyticus TaxID=2764187 RepID=A0A923SET3_9BURK|nr:molybdopterin-dependent oxidoreductase [Ramlibacter cellulosilyticus]MBC5783267.1 molybdopterin-dependent oxidoreductase [Ramlibacter cellulosilyticus]